MIYNVNVDAAKALLQLDKGSKRMVYGVVGAINATATAVQAGLRQRITQVTTVRKPLFIMRQVKLFKASFSTTTGRGNWQARVGIGLGKELQGSPLLLPKLETGGQRAGVKGPGVAIPVVGGARPTQAQSVPENLYVQRLQLRRTQRGRPKKNPKPVKAGTIVRQGLLGTYQISKVGIFQRVTGALKGVALYIFKPIVRLPATLQAYRTAKQIIDRDFPRNMKAQINDAFARHG